MSGYEESRAGTRLGESLYARQLRLVRVLLIGLLAAAILIVALSLVVVGPGALSVQGLLSILAVVAVISLALLQLRRGKMERAVAWSAASLLILLSYEVLEGGVEGSTGILLGFTIPIVLAGLLLHRTALMVSAIASASVLVFVRIAEQAGVAWVAVDIDSASPDTQVIIFVLVIGLLTLILDRFGGTLRQAYDEAVHREQELEVLNRTLRSQMAERAKAEAARQLSEGSLELASEVVGGLGTWSLDRQSGTVTWSDSLRALLGVPAEEPASVESFLRLVHPEDRAGVTKRPSDLDQLTNLRVSEFRIVRPDGNVCWIETRYRILRDDSGRERLIGVIYDVTGHKSVEHELERRVAARTRDLTAVNEELEAFTYSASHDLRAPVRAVDGFATALVEDYGPEFGSEARHYVERIRGAARKMSELIDGLLLLSTSTRGDLDVGPVNLSQLADEVVEDLRQHSPDREVDVHVAPGLATLGDRALLRIMLENLLGNAFKFTAEVESPQIQIGSRTVGDETVFFVRDNGVGFDMQHAGRLFGPFQRLHDKGFEGSGIGLAIVQRVILRHGGRIWAESEPGRGATFYFAINVD